MPILAEDGKIVWCDINPYTGNIDTGSLKNQIVKYANREIGAISFVDFAGYPADLTSLRDISDFSGIPLIEDAAQSLGAKWNGENVGNVAEFTALSFQAIKQLTTGDGGALIVPSNKGWERVKRLKWFGINRDAIKEATRWHYDIPEWGYKAHMNNINATIGLTQLPYIDSNIAKHKKNGKYFDQVLQGVYGLTTLFIPKESEPAYWIYMVKVERRDQFAQMMQNAGIAVNVAHIRNDKYSCFKYSSNVLNSLEERPGLEMFNENYIGIPCGWWLTLEDREYIVETIKKGW
jgi:dTDP-4-amino-4,6-dideoxygalactose transaminase